MPYNLRADVVRLLAERYDTKSNGFRSRLQASCVFSHPEELLFNETIRLYIYIYIERERERKKDCVDTESTALDDWQFLVYRIFG